MGAPGQRSASVRPSALATASRLPSAGSKVAGPCVIQMKSGRDGLPSSSTGTGPILSSRTNREAPSGAIPCAASTHAVPTVGCPAKGNSRAGVKIRSAATQSGRDGGKRNTVSDKFISRAIFCMTASSSPRASRSTASGLPANTRSVNTSTCTKRYEGEGMTEAYITGQLHYPSPSPNEREGQMKTLALRGGEGLGEGYPLRPRSMVTGDALERRVALLRVVRRGRPWRRAPGHG